MELVEVDPVRLQTLQAAVQGRHDVGAVQSRLAAAKMRQPCGRAGNLGGQNHPVTTTARRKPGADIGFGPADGLRAWRDRIHLGRVDEVDPRGERTVELGMCLGLAVLLTEGHGAEAKCADADVRAPERSELHCVLLNRVGDPGG